MHGLVPLQPLPGTCPPIRFQTAIRLFWQKKHGGGFDELNIVRDDAELRTRISPIGTANEFEVEAHG